MWIHPPDTPPCRHRCIPHCEYHTYRRRWLNTDHDKDHCPPAPKSRTDHLKNKSDLYHWATFHSLCYISLARLFTSFIAVVFLFFLFIYFFYLKFYLFHFIYFILFIYLFIYYYYYYYFFFFIIIFFFYYYYYFFFFSLLRILAQFYQCHICVYKTKEEVGRKEMFYLTTYCHHMGYSFWLTARVLLYAPPHRQDSTCHGLCYISHGALAGTRNSSMGPPWRVDITTHRIMRKRSYHRATSQKQNKK